MKKMIFLSIVTILGFTNCHNKSNSKKIDNFIPKKERIEFAENLADKILKAQKKGLFYNLSKNEANLKMINGLNQTLQKASYEQIKNLFGDYKSLKFESYVEITKTEKYEIYRFKGEFEFNSNVEIRSVLNTDGKLAGFFVKPWKDEL